jgi:hypothetical protein
MAARAQQHGGTAGFAFIERAAWAWAPSHPRSLCGLGLLGFSAVLCVSRARRCAAQRALGILGPFWACLAAPRAAWLALPRARAQQHAGGLFCRAHFFLRRRVLSI